MNAGTVGRALASLGLVLLVTGAVIGVTLFGARSWLTLVPMGTGAVALAVGLSLGARSLDRSRVRLGVEIALVAAALVLINALAVRTGALVDVTSSGRNTLAESSAAAARSLTVPVTVEAALAGEDRAFADLELLVARYQVHSAKLTLVRRDPSRGHSALNEARVTLAATIEGEARRQRLSFVAGSPDQEQQMTNALRAVTSTKRPRAYVLAGHAEPSVADAGPSGMRRFGQALADEGLEIVPLPLASLERVPEDAALVIVAAPAEPAEGTLLGAAEVERLQRFLDGGGRLLVLLEPSDTYSDALAGLLGSIGVQASSDVIIDGSAFSGLLGGPETATGVAYAAHPVTAKLGASLTHFPRARSLAENPIPDVVMTALVQTDAAAFGDTTPRLAGVPRSSGTGATDADVKGPMTLVLAAERRNSASAPSRVVIVGDSTFATNAAIGLGANLDLALHAAQWLADREDQIAVRPRGRGGNLLLLSPTSRERIAFVLLYGLPVMLLGAGLTIRAVRRRH